MNFHYDKNGRVFL